MYDPVLGRFIQKDPIGYSGGDPNFYRYVGNNPANLTDSSGQFVDQQYRGDGNYPRFSPLALAAYLETELGQQAVTSINSDRFPFYYRTLMLNGRSYDAAHAISFFYTTKMLSINRPYYMASHMAYFVGIGVEEFQSFIGSPSGYSPEDIPSNILGIRGARNHEDFVNFLRNIEVEDIPGQCYTYRCLHPR